LFEAFDAFVDLLAENLIKERAFSHIGGSPGQDNDTIRGLIQTFDEILGPLLVLEDWLRSIVFHVAGLSIRSFFQDANASIIRDLCTRIRANTEEARNWRHLIGYPPLVSER
jgi:hypothetical protein